MKLIWKLLGQHISKTQLAGFFCANLIGMTIVLLSVQFYYDVRPLFAGKESLMKKEYLVVTKKISTLGTLTGKSNVFSKEEREEIGRQKFVRNMGTFTSSRFNVTTGIALEKMGVNLSTDMFFESVPDEYIDADLSQWTFKEEDRTIPIILPRNYLNLYNFGFAQSRNLPKLSEGVFGMVNLNVSLSGNGREEAYKGRIAGFSDRLNTILVPEHFMEWANRTFAGADLREPSRLIVEVTNPADEELSRFFQSKGYETEDGKLENGKTAWFLKVTFGLVFMVGVLICVLSVYLLMLSIYLLLQKNTTKLENLLLIGYRRNLVARPYQLLALGLNGVVVLFAIGSVILLREIYTDALTHLWPLFEKGSLWPVICCGTVLFVSVSSVNCWIIRRKVNHI